MPGHDRGRPPRNKSGHYLKRPRSRPALTSNPTRIPLRLRSGLVARRWADRTRPHPEEHPAPHLIDQGRRQEAAPTDSRESGGSLARLGHPSGVVQGWLQLRAGRSQDCRSESMTSGRNASATRGRRPAVSARIGTWRDLVTNIPTQTTHVPLETEFGGPSPRRRVLPTRAGPPHAGRPSPGPWTPASEQSRPRSSQRRLPSLGVRRSLRRITWIR